MGCDLKKNYKRKLVIVLAIFIFLIWFLYYQNNSLKITEFKIQSDEIPESFDKYRIVQLSDLHSKSFGKNQKVLIEKVKNSNPDLIVFTGDLVDQKKYNEEISLVLIEGLVQIAPVYFVTGNHEWWSGNFSALEEKLTNLDVNILRNTSAEIQIGEEKITIIGIDDPSIGKESADENDVAEEALKTSLQGLDIEDSFNILLSHRPELFSLYTQYDIDLIFSGHAHGGQFRMPFLGGILAPNQGFLPEYTTGKYNEKNSTMIVNRGLGNSIIPQRLFNRPEIVVVTLSSLN